MRSEAEVQTAIEYWGEEFMVAALAGDDAELAVVRARLNTLRWVEGKRNVN